MTAKKFKHSDFAKGDRVNCPHGEGKVTRILFHFGEYWYQVGEGVSFYSEHELKKIEPSK